MKPLQILEIFPLLHSRAGNQSLVAVVMALLQKGTITPVPSSKVHHMFSSTCSLIQKKNDGLYLEPERVHQLLLHALFIVHSVIHTEQSLVFYPVDVNFHIPIQKSHRRYFCFFFQNNAYGYTVLPVGLSLSPCSSTKYVEAALAPLHHQGIIS